MNWNDMTQFEKNLSVVLIGFIVFCVIVLARFMWTRYMGIPFEFQPMATPLPTEILPTMIPLPTPTSIFSTP